jgi:hypothetical protein
MSTAERDFSNFNLGDNVYELADGLVPEMAEQLGVDIGQEPSSEDLQLLMNQVGPKKELRSNPEIELPIVVKADFVDRSGVQNALDRSLWTPEITIANSGVDGVVMTGGVANWLDRIGYSVVDDVSQRVEGSKVYIPVGNRVMQLATEKTNSNVEIFFDDLGRYPTETEYVGHFIVPVLEDARYEVIVEPHETQNGDEILSSFFERNRELLESKLAMVRVANAGVIMAIQMRDAARSLRAEFDTDPENPQVFVATDSFPIARTEEQDEDAQHFQKSDSGFRQVVLTAKKLHEATA